MLRFSRRLREARGDVLDRALEVRADGLGRAVRVARDASRQDRAVLAVQARDGKVVGGAVDVQVRARRVAQRGDHLHELAPPRVHVDAGVEALVELQVARRGRAVTHLVEQHLERRGPFGLEALGRLRGGKPSSAARIS